jgi:tetratricopeptide (TPR) repeat protein
MIRKICICLFPFLTLLPFQAEAQTGRILIEVGDSRYEFGDIKGAIEAYTLAIELNPEFAPAWERRGMARADLGDDDGAIADYTRAIEINEENLTYFLNRAASKYNLSDYYGAIDDYGHVIELEPDNPIALYGRGLSQIQIRRSL